MRATSRFAFRCPLIIPVILSAALRGPAEAPGVAAHADEPARAAQAPPNHDPLKRVRGGVYFVSRPLKERYDKLLARLEALQNEIAAAQIPAPEAKDQLVQLQKELASLRQEIEAQKVLVSPVKIHTRAETVTFDLGPQRMLVVTADSLRVESWDGPQVKCVLEKTVLADKDQGVDEHLRGIRLVHQHGRGENVVDYFTEAPTEYDEAAFLLFREFQGQEIDVVQIEGLTHEQGNRQILVGAESKGGGGMFGSDWQRHATLTVFVPACRALALRGCLAKLDVWGLNTSLIVTSKGSRYRDYYGTFQIRNVQGALAVDNVPMQSIENVQGNVSFTATQEFSNTGTLHHKDMRVSYAPAPLECSCKNIAGDFTASCGRISLKLQDVSGKINVRNDFGDTYFVATRPLALADHRLVTDGGRIEVDLAKKSLDPLPVMALSGHGKVSTNTRREVLDDFNVSGTDATLGGRRSWRGMISKPADEEDPLDHWYRNRLQRPGRAWSNQERPAGLDLLSRGGTVVVRINE